MKECLKCHASVADEAESCPVCGQDFSQYNHCPNCGSAYLGFAYFCSMCGNPLYDLGNNMSKQEGGDGPTVLSEKSPIPDDQIDEHIHVAKDQVKNYPKNEMPDNESVQSDNSDMPFKQSLLSDDIDEKPDSELQKVENVTSPTIASHEELEDQMIVVDEDEYQDVSDNPKVHKNADDDSIIDIPAHEVKQMQSTHLQNVHKEKLYISKDNVKPKKRKKFKWGIFLLVLFFIAVITGGVIAFLRYDREFDRKKDESFKARLDSIEKVQKSKKQKLAAQQNALDSISKTEFDEIQRSDSLNKINRIAERKADSARVDTFMTRVIKDISPSNVVLARFLDGKNYIYYYSDTLQPIFNLSCFDGVSKQTYNVIDNIQARLVGHIVTPDYKSLIVMCKDDKHGFGLAYRVDMAENTYVEYESMDDDNNKCYDISATSDGFMMRFGKGDQKSFVNKYTAYFDRYGNFIKQE